MSIRKPRRHLLTVSLTTMSLALAFLAGGHSASAQEGEVDVLLRAFACPTSTPANPFAECEAMIGATFEVVQDGDANTSEIVTIEEDTGIGPGVTFVSSVNAVLTITLLSGASDGYVAAPGFDPFSANVQDLPDVGFGGESTGPGVNFITIISDDTGEETGTSDVSTLPVTGAGTIETNAGDQADMIGLLLIAVTILGGGWLSRKARIS